MSEGGATAAEESPHRVVESSMKGFFVSAAALLDQIDILRVMSGVSFFRGKEISLNILWERGL